MYHAYYCVPNCSSISVLSFVSSGKNIWLRSKFFVCELASFFLPKWSFRSLLKMFAVCAVTNALDWTGMNEHWTTFTLVMNFPADSRWTSCQNLDFRENEGTVTF